MQRKFLFTILATITLINFIHAYKTDYKIEKISDNKQKILLTFTLDPKEVLYNDTISITPTDKAISISPIKSNPEPTKEFDPRSGKTKVTFKDKVQFSFEIEKKDNENLIKPAIHVHFATNNDKQPQQLIIPIEMGKKLQTKEKISENINEVVQDKPYTPQHTTSSALPQKSKISNFFYTTINSISGLFKKWKDALAALFTETGSGLIRLIVALILGILLSLTPCIYPMIPITIGVLQANKSTTGSSNFLMAGAYTLGISLTFAILGLIASVGSSVFGSMQGSPWVILPLVLLLGYLGLAMFGFYEMYIPKFFQPKSTTVSGGSYLSAFTFGAISGTVASPCMSPGLALILDWVTNLSQSGSIMAYLESFGLLFTFGIGSSLPLLIIGTFSTSANLLPKAGLWMVEVKKILGLMLIGMCFYHLSHLEKYLPWYILIWFIIATLIFFGIYYFYSIQPYDSKPIRWFKNLMGVILIVSACVLSLNGFKAVYNHLYPQETDSLWSHDYNASAAKAKSENKNLFIDIGASHCGICKAIDKTVLKNEQVLSALKNYVMVKVDADSDEISYNELLKHFGDYIKKTAFPTFLIVDAKDNKVIKHFGSEFKDLEINGIVELLEKNR